MCFDCSAKFSELLLWSMYASKFRGYILSTLDSSLWRTRQSELQCVPYFLPASTSPETLLEMQICGHYIRLSRHLIKTWLINDWLMIDWCLKTFLQGRYQVIRSLIKFDNLEMESKRKTHSWRGNYKRLARARVEMCTGDMGAQGRALNICFLEKVKNKLSL